MRVPLLLPLAFLVAPLAPSQPQPLQGQLDASSAIFTVLAAYNAASDDAEIDSAHPLREFVRRQLDSQKLESVTPLKRFIRDHRKPDRGRDLSQYISYALVLEPPPLFGYRYPIQALPPDAAELDGMAPLLAAFYKEAHLGELWIKVQPYFDQAIDQLHEPVSHAVLQVNSYLRNPTSGYLGRRFQIYVDLLGAAPNQVQTRSYVDDYFVVVTPAGKVNAQDGRWWPSALPIEEIEHAYLHYMLDPLVIKFSKQMMQKHALADYAMGAPSLDDQYKSDYILMATECLIKAVESRIQRRPGLVDQALREGFVLTPVFAEQLAIYEKQDRALRLHFPEMVDAIDLKREEKRLENVEYAKVPGRKIHVVTTEKEVQLTGPEKELDDAETVYSGRDFPRAKEAFLHILQEPVEKKYHAKAYYGLARIAVLQRDPELGDRLFRKVLELEPDASTKSWSFLYLARLADSQGDRDQAQENYKAALAVEGAPDSVRQAADKGLKEAFTKK